MEELEEGEIPDAQYMPILSSPITSKSESKNSQSDICKPAYGEIDSLYGNPSMIMKADLVIDLSSCDEEVEFKSQTYCISSQVESVDQPRSTDPIKLACNYTPLDQAHWSVLVKVSGA